MNPKITQPTEPVTPTTITKVLAPAYQVTSFSKILAAGVFIMLPFIGGYVGYKMAVNTQLVEDTDKLNIVDQSQVDVQNVNQHFFKLADGQSFVSDENVLLGYRRADNRIYLIEQNGSERILKEVATVNPDNFFVSKSKSMFAHDGVNVYVEGNPIPEADVASFIPLIGLPSGLDIQMAVSKDKNFVYIYDKKLDQADAASFVALGRFGERAFNNLGIDKNAVYEFGLDFQTRHPLVLDTGESIDIPETENLKVMFDNIPGVKHITYPDIYMGWFDYRFGLVINETYYINRGYLIDEALIYSMYDICTGISENRMCTFTISKVNEIGEIPKSILELANKFGVESVY